MARQANAALSATLAAAQEQLQRRRRERRQERIEQHLPVHTDTHGRLISPPPHYTQVDQPPIVASHLGWQSEALTSALRAAQQRQQALAAQVDAQTLRWLTSVNKPTATREPALAPAKPDDSVDRNAIALYPDVAVAMLRAGLVSPGRLWLLLRYLDTEGRGWISVAEAKSALTCKGSALRICGWRQLRNLLAQGEGILWQRDAGSSGEGRIWLRSTVKVAVSLDVHQLHLRPVHLPVSVLLETVGTVRAHFYASYHSGRTTSNPIARRTMTELTRVSRRSQRAYERRANVKQQQNWAIGAPYTQEAAQERAWKQGCAIFRFKDHQGLAGAPGKCYVAWQLPNSYIGPHKQHTNASKKRINQQLVDLFMKGITGNGEEAVDESYALSSDGRVMAPRFYQHGEAAVKAYNRSPEQDRYWQSYKRVQASTIWHVLPALNASDNTK